MKAEVIQEMRKYNPTRSLPLLMILLFMNTVLCFREFAAPTLERCHDLVNVLDDRTFYLVYKTTSKSYYFSLAADHLSLQIERTLDAQSSSIVVRSSTGNNQFYQNVESATAISINHLTIDSNMDVVTNDTLTFPTTTANVKFKMMECSKIAVHCFFYSFEGGYSEHLNKIDENDNWLESWSLSTSGYGSMKLKRSPSLMVLTGTKMTTLDTTISDSGSYELSSVVNDFEIVLAPIIGDKIAAYYDFTLKMVSNSDGVEDASITIVGVALIHHVRSEGMRDTKYALLLYCQGSTCKVRLYNYIELDWVGDYHASGNYAYSVVNINDSSSFLVCSRYESLKFINFDEEVGFFTCHATCETCLSTSMLETDCKTCRIDSELQPNGICKENCHSSCSVCISVTECIRCSIITDVVDLEHGACCPIGKFYDLTLDNCIDCD